MKIVLGGLAAACMLSLTACGGGAGGDSHQSSENAERALPAGSVPIQVPADEVLVISLPTGVIRGNSIVIKNSAGQTVQLSYVTSNNLTLPVTTIDDLPKGLENYPWVAGKSAPNNLRIKFKAGEYEMNSGWGWGYKTSGHVVGGIRYSIILEPNAAAGAGASENVVFLGSKKFTGTPESGTANYVVGLTNVVPFDQLWSSVDGRMVRARQPNIGGFYYVDEPVSASPLAIKVYENDQAAITLAAGSSVSQPELVLFGNFFVTRHPLVAGPNAAREVTLATSPNLNRPANIDVRRNERYFLENYAAALDSSREWFFSKSATNGGLVSGTLKFRPVSTSYAMEVPQLPVLLAMTGDVTDAAKQVSDVQFDRLKFRYTRGASTDGVGSTFSQAELYVPAAINLTAAKYVQFFNCEVSHVGGSGVRFGRQVTQSRFEKGEVFDTGANGIMVGGDPQPDVGVDPLDRLDFNAGLLTSNVSILENRVHSVGARYPTANGIWVGRTTSVTIQDNIVKDTVHSGIAVGSWKEQSTEVFPTPFQGNNKVINNYVYNIGAKGLSDLGGIYTLGPNASATFVQKNLVRRVDPYESMARGVYLDEYSSLVNVTHNIVVPDAAYGTLYGVGQHFGDENLIQNNVLRASSAIAISERSLLVSGVSNKVPLTFNNNYFFSTTAQVIHLPPVWDIRLINNGAWVTTEPVRSGNHASASAVAFWNTEPFLNDTALQALCGCAPDLAMSMSDPGWPSVPAFQNIPVSAGLYDASKLSGMVAKLSANWVSTNLWQGDFKLAPNRFTMGTTGPDAYSGVQTDSSQPEDSSWGIAGGGSNKPVNFKILRDTTDKVTDYFEMTDGQDDSTTAYFPSIARGFATNKGERITVDFRVKFDANADLRHAWRKSNIDWNVVGPQIDFKASSVDQKVHVWVNGQDVRSVALNTWVSVSVVMVLEENGPQWLLSVKPDGATSYLGTFTAASGANFVTMGEAYFASNYVGTGANKSVTKFNYIRVTKD